MMLDSCLSFPLAGERAFFMTLDPLVDVILNYVNMTLAQFWARRMDVCYFKNGLASPMMNGKPYSPHNGFHSWVLAMKSSMP